MTGLLVSVRSVTEAKVALRCGVQVLDVKEPSRGSLGRADAGVLDEVLHFVAGRVPVSAALGELVEWPRERVQGSGVRDQKAGLRQTSTASCILHPASCRLRLAAGVPPSLSFAKLGLARCASDPHWSQRWASVLDLLPSNVGRVAVAYADWREAEAPCPEEILEKGGKLGCRAALIDTYDKRGGALFDHLTPAALARWIARAREWQMITVVAGSLNEETAKRAADLVPGLIAVRGAACHGGREGPLDPRRIASLWRLLAKQ